jgi:transaldolase
MIKLNKLNIKIFADGADLKSFRNLNSKNFIKGFTTNPSLMKKSGIKNYKKFAQDLIKEISDKPISFEVFEDEIIGMEKQARQIAAWGKNVYVKIPITNTKGESTHELVKKLSDERISCNVTAIFTFEQFRLISDSINNETPAILSVFAGRIADTGIDPMPIMRKCIKYTKNKKNIEILWASTREVFNIFQANSINCQIITVPNDLLKKLNNLNKDLKNFSKETVMEFYKDAKSAGFKI